jgi:7-keto-8-aminopelargonate synthetase-like enzyme
MKVSPTQIDPTHVRQDGRRLVYFGGCDYFRLSWDPRVRRALQEGVGKFGLNVAASRTTSGNHPLYGRLERELADFFGVESATLAPNGWAPSLMAAQALAGRFSHVLIDEKAHPSLAAAALHLVCPIVKFRHHDAADLARALARLRPCQPLVMTDGMVPRDGSVAPVRDYLKILPRGGLILLDDAHAAGVLGETGRGTAQLAGASSRHILQTITLSKAFGVFGGAVLGARKFTDAIMAGSGVFIGSTPLPPPLAAAALESLRILRTNGPLRERLHRNARYVREELGKRGMAVADTPGPVIAVFPKNPQDARRLSRRLLAAQICPPFSRYPGGPPGGCFRFAISSAHSPRQLRELVAALAGQ